MNSEERYGQVTTFIGTTPNIGTTLLALTTSVRLAEQSGSRVAYICFNLKSSKLHRYLNASDQRASLDELLPHLRNSGLDQHMLQHAMHPYSKSTQLHLLFGNTYRETAEYFGVEELIHLIHIARKSYDYIFLDVNAYWDNAGTISALQEADCINVVTTNALSHFQEDYLSWIGSMGEHIQLNHKQLCCTVIKQTTALYQVKHCYRQLQGRALPAVIIPTTIYEALDRGELTVWLQQHSEGKRWLSTYTKSLIPFQTPPSSNKKFLGQRAVTALTSLLLNHK